MSEIKTAPYAVAALVLGICSLLFGCFFVGLVCGIVGLILANKGRAEYTLHPNEYSGLAMLNAGRIMSILGIVFGALYILYYIIFVLIVGTAGFSILNLLDL